MNVKIVFLVTLLAFSDSAIAAASWSFAGIYLGAPITASKLPDCPTPVGSALLTWTPPTAICVTSVSKKSADGMQIADLDGLTVLHWRETYGGYAAIWDDRVVSVRIHIGQDAYESVKQILTKRYGKPATVKQGSVTSYGGAVVSSSTVTWHESGNTIQIQERCERIDRSCVDVYNDAAMRARLAAKKSDAEADASIL